MDDLTLSPSQDERIDVFASVQYDPEVWELVQKKFHHFEDLHKQMEEHQAHRRDLMQQLSEVNDTISELQEQLITLSGKEKVEQEMAKAEADMPEPEQAKPAVEVETVSDIASEDSQDDDQPTVGLAPLAEPEESPTADTASHVTADAEPSPAWPSPDLGQSVTGSDSEVNPTPDTSSSLSAEPEGSVSPASSSAIDVATYQSVADDSNPPNQVAFAQPHLEADTPAEPVLSEVTAEATPSDSKPEEMPVIDIPAEVSELQQLFDQADEQRRQSDSALKLVQLYDGKAEVFFTAMCRSHAQNGLDQTEARQEALKDVQTMIATAKAHKDASPIDEAKKTNGGMRRLFSH